MAIKKVWSFLSRSERRQGILLFMFMIVGMLLECLGVGLVIPVITTIMSQDITNDFPFLLPVLEFFGNPEQATVVIGAMTILVAVFLIKNGFLAFLAWGQAHFAYGVVAHLSERLLVTYLRQPYTFHLQRNSAQLIRNIIGEVNLFGFNYFLPGLNVITEGLVMFGLCALLLTIEPLGTLIVLLVLIGVCAVFRHSTSRLLIRHGETRQKYDGLRVQLIQEALGGVKDIKILGREDDFLDQFHRHNTQWMIAGRFQRIIQRLPALSVELIAVTALSVMVVVMLSSGRTPDMVLPTLGLFAAAAFRLMPSSSRILSSLQSMRFGLPVIEILHQDLHLDVPSQKKENDHEDAVNHFLNNIRLSEVTFVYEGMSDPTLSEISLSIRQGESVGFIGPSGSGKSTLVDVILGLLSPHGGDVAVDDENIQLDLNKWQKQIGYVPQSIFLTDDTLRRNIAFGLPDDQIDEGAIRSSIKVAQLDQFVGGLPEGLETIVGERGVRLSGGQRQRIGIARALYHRPSVLVLDEATSALDTTTESEVMQVVTALQGSKTLLIVAHRYSTVARCDRIYRLEHGRIVEAGTPEQLLDVGEAVG